MGQEQTRPAADTRDSDTFKTARSIAPPPPPPTLSPPSLYPTGDNHTHPHSQYMTRLIELSSGPELLEKKLWPDAKELSESFACLEAFTRLIKPILPHPVSDKVGSCAIVAVGDGSTPRTAALFSYVLGREGWWSYAVDPQMGEKPCVGSQRDSTHPQTPGGDSVHSLGAGYADIQNLFVHRGPIEECVVTADTVVLVLMHAHVSLATAVACVNESAKNVYIITCPCCNWAPKQTRFQGRKPDHEGLDWGIWSEKRLMRVWTKDTGDREGFHVTGSVPNAPPPAPAPVKRGSSKGGAEKKHVQKLVDACRSWISAPDAGSALEIATQFYESFPSSFSASPPPALPATPSTHAAWLSACTPLAPSDVSPSPTFAFTGRLHAHKAKLQCLGRSLLFFSLLVKTPFEDAFEEVRVIVTEVVLTGEPLEGGGGDVKVTARLLAEALKTCPGCVKIIGRAAKSKCGKHNLLSAERVQVVLPPPRPEVIEERRRARREVFGMWRRDARFYTENGTLAVDFVECKKTGVECGGQDEYAEHCRHYFSSVIV